jgi:dephospho-CoA kinase
MDAVACVSISAEIQQERVLARGTMTLEQFENIRSKQMPNTEKCALSDYVIETDTLDHARAQVLAIIDDIKGKMNHA